MCCVHAGRRPVPPDQGMPRWLHQQRQQRVSVQFGGGFRPTFRPIFPTMSPIIPLTWWFWAIMNPSLGRPAAPLGTSASPLYAAIEFQRQPLAPPARRFPAASPVARPPRRQAAASALARRSPATARPRPAPRRRLPGQATCSPGPGAARRRRSRRRHRPPDSKTLHLGHQLRRTTFQYQLATPMTFPCAR